MITLQADASPTVVLELLQRAFHDLANTRNANTLKDALDQYLLWTYRTTQLLSPHIRGDDVERMINTKRYWLLQGIVNPLQDSMTRHLIDLEISERQRDFADEINEINTMTHLWKIDFRSPVALILDTNILLDHYHELGSYDWNKALNLRSNVPIILTIPVVVIDELDRLKISKAKSNDKEQTTFRTKARLALKMLDSTFQYSNGRHLLHEEEISGGSGHQSAIHLAVLIDEMGHIPMDHVDSEIVDRATTLSPFVGEVRIATYDTGMALRARQSGLEVCKFEYVFSSEN